MKTMLYFFVLLFLPIIMVGQESAQDNMLSPEYSGIQNNHFEKITATELLGVYLCDNINCPGVTKGCFKEGTIVVRFKVMPSGELTDIEVVNSVCPEVDKEFVRLLKATNGMWDAGTIDGKPEVMEKELSMLFVANPYVNDPKEYFNKRAEENFVKGNKFFLNKSNPEKALKFYDASIKYRPNEASSLLLRGLCRYEAGDKNGACRDWNRINALGNANVDKYMENLCEMEGYDEMASILNE